ncbi:MAG: hypothetical protein WDN27_03820 [Candidatus Saccharibacteria bacterium]
MSGRSIKLAHKPAGAGKISRLVQAYAGSPTLASSTLATYTYQAPALSLGTQYWWRAYAIDPAGTNTFTVASSIQSFTTDSAPAAPTLVSPANGTTGVSLTPRFDLRTTDADSDYLQYGVQICTTSNCSTVLRTVCQVNAAPGICTVTQTGWQDKDQQSAAAYTGAPVITNSTLATYFYGYSDLVPSTQYWWRAYAIDAGGSNTISSASSIWTFTTGANELRIDGGSKILGGSKLNH